MLKSGGFPDMYVIICGSTKVMPQWKQCMSCKAGSFIWMTKCWWLTPDVTENLL